jgi:hypothetical protein
MKFSLKFIGIAFLGLLFSQTMNAQNKSGEKTTPPSDVSSGYTFDYNKTIDLIIEREITPQKSNEDVQIILNQKDFPVLQSGKVADAEYKELLGKWIIENQTLIINTLKGRTNIVTQY